MYQEEHTKMFMNINGMIEKHKYMYHRHYTNVTSVSRYVHDS